MAGPTNREILEAPRGSMVSSRVREATPAQPTICYYFKLQKSIAADKDFRHTLDLETTQKGFIQQYHMSLRSLERENAVIQDWLKYLDATPQLRFNLHNNQKAALVNQLKIMLDLNHTKPNSTSNSTLVEFINDFSNSDESNLLVFAKNRQATKQLEASLAFLKEMQVKTEISPTLSIALQARMAAQMAQQCCARFVSDPSDPTALGAENTRKPTIKI